MAQRRSPTPAGMSTSAETQPMNTGAAAQPQLPAPQPLAALFTASCMGICFGFLFEKSHVYEPQAIRGQFNFERWIMMKMFMGAVTASCFSFVLLSVFAPQRFETVRLNFHPIKRGLLSGGALGGGLLGVGMAVAGACPGMVLPQVGTGLPNALLITLGGVIGALAFGLLEPVLRSSALDKGAQCSGTADDFVDIKLGKPFVALCLPLGVVCGAASILLEVLVPYESELGLPVGGAELGEILYAKAWPPALAGALLGSLQLPCAAIIQASLGSSSSYECVASIPLALAGSATKKRFSYLEGKRSGGVGSWWQVFYVSFAILGAYVSAQLSGTFPTSASGVPAPSALIGGFLMLFGSRLAGGCTSGHGISGMPLLHTLSLVAVCAMFGAGIVTGLVLDAMDLLEIPPLVGRL